jgi:tRNA uridine 5-carbamoylmethylation protein Kti12
MRKLIVLSGVSGSGKTTKAKELFEQYAAQEDFVLKLERDHERVATEIKDETELSMHLCRKAYLWLSPDRIHSADVVIVDSPNLTQWDKDCWQLVGYMLSPHVELEWIDMPTKLYDCIERDARRQHPVGHIAIAMQWNEKANQI